MGEDFFGLLRAWHERKNSPVWSKLRIVILHIWFIESSNINQSPLNVGHKIKLPELTLVQVQKLVTLHGLTWQEEQIRDLTDLVGFHPFLIRFALYHIAIEETSLDVLLSNAHLEDSLFQDHFMWHLRYLESNQKLRLMMAEVVNNKIPEIIRSSIELRQLQDAGLIKLDGDRVLPANRLYQLYFANRL